MRLPRMTTRRWMLAVAVVGVSLTAARPVYHWRHYQVVAAMHAGKEFSYVRQAEGCERKRDWCADQATIPDLQPESARGRTWERLATSRSSIAAGHATARCTGVEIQAKVRACRPPPLVLRSPSPAGAEMNSFGRKRWMIGHPFQSQRRSGHADVEELTLPRSSYPHDHLFSVANQTKSVVWGSARSDRLRPHPLW